MTNSKYENAKQAMLSKGINPGEIYVYHGSDLQTYPKICRGGFLIGGKDVDVAIGSVYGLGVYTATDATSSIIFSKSNGRLLICKALRGRITETPIKKVAELDTTEYHSLFVDFKGTKSNFYVFFKTDYIVPLYVVEYK